MRVNRNNPNTPEFFTAYHGSRAKFDKFDPYILRSKIFGFGTYVAVDRGAIEKSYANPGDDVWMLGDEDLFNVLPREARGAYNMFLFRHYDENLDEIINGMSAYANASIFNKRYWELKRNRYGKVSKSEVNALLDFLLKNKSDIRLGHKPRYLYEVDIPDDNGTNYIPPTATVDQSVLDRVNNALHTFTNIEDALSGPINGMSMQDELDRITGSMRAANDILNAAGITGFRYHDESLGECRVIFNADDIKITDRTEFFKTRNGQVYGYATPEGAIYLDENIISPEHPIHEYTHLWDRVVIRKTEPPSEFRFFIESNHKSRLQSQGWRVKPNTK